MRATITNGKTGTYTKIAQILANNTTYTDTTANPTVSYSYRVDAFNAATDPSHTAKTLNENSPTTMYNSGTQSNAVSVLAAPEIPSNLKAVQSGSKVNLTWTSGANTSGFKVERSTDGTNFSVIDQPTVANSTDSNVTAGTKYYYRVKAVNGTLESGYSSIVNITIANNTTPAPTAPSNLSAVWQSGQSSGVNLSWTDNASNETGFVIQRSTDGVNFSTLPNTNLGPRTGTGRTVSYTDKTATALGTTYYYQVMAMNGSTASNASNIATIIAGAPPTPTLTQTNALTGGIKLSWFFRTSGTVSKYVIQAATDQNFTKNIKSVEVTGNSNMTSASITGLNRNTTYYVRIQTVNQYGSSTWSNSLSRRTN
jgi:hypothetical protein